MKTKFDTINIEEKQSGVFWLVLYRPEKHNSMSAQMLVDLSEAVAGLAANRDVRAVVLTGEGKSFCAGGDLGWMREQFAATREERVKEARVLAHMLRDLNTLPKPLIGRVQGQAFGGGIGMMCVCDHVVACEGLKFGLTETRLGLIPATISPYVLARMGEGKARQVFMSAGMFDTHKAFELGIVSQIVVPEELDNAVERAVKPYLSAAPGAVAASKDLARFLGPTIDEHVIEETINRLADTWETDEAKEGVGAFFDKRKANWML